MARVTDPSKLEKIKRVTMEMMSENGYRDMTVSKIAKKAGVSAGYLYRHYNGKYELINELCNEYFELFNNQLDASISPKSSFEDVVHLYVSSLIEMALEDSVPIMFLSSLISDRSFHREDREENAKKKLGELAKRIISNRVLTGEVRKDIEITDFVLFFVEIPLNYVYMRLIKSFDSYDLKITDADKLTSIITKALS